MIFTCLNLHGTVSQIASYRHTFRFIIRVQTLYRYVQYWRTSHFNKVLLRAIKATFCHFEPYRSIILQQNKFQPDIHFHKLIKVVYQLPVETHIRNYSFVLPTPQCSQSLRQFISGDFFVKYCSPTLVCYSRVGLCFFTKISPLGTRKIFTCYSNSVFNLYFSRAISNLKIFHAYNIYFSRKPMFVVTNINFLKQLHLLSKYWCKRRKF